MKRRIDEGKILLKSRDTDNWLHADSVSQKNSSEYVSRELIWQLPESVGSGHFISNLMPGDLALTISDITLSQPLNAHLEEVEKMVHLVFALKGSSINTNASFKKGFTVKEGYNSMYWTCDSRLKREAQEGATLKNVVISFPQSRLAALDTGSGISRQEAALIQHQTTPAMNLVLYQIFHCQLNGPAKQLFLESKALELMSLKWAAMEPSAARHMTREQLMGVEKVQELLLANISNPPSIHSLSKAAGMSHPVLNRCFKEHTGSSVFEFLRQKRLELSRNLVKDSRKSMTEIAFEAGYASSSHFSRAFAAYYGMQPSRYRAQVTGTTCANYRSKA